MKKGVITFIIILAVLVLAFTIMNRAHPNIEKSVAECIGEKSTLYVQLGCSACEKQEEMFGDDYQYLEVVDCFFDRELCGEIQYTPTWIINGEEHVGVQSIDELKNLTGC